MSGAYCCELQQRGGPSRENPRIQEIEVDGLQNRTSGSGWELERMQGDR
jgi:hypothetical protein